MPRASKYQNTAAGLRYLAWAIATCIAIVLWWGFGWLGLGVLVGLIAALMISAELRSRRERLGHELRWLWVSVTTFVLTTVAVGVILAILFYWLVHGGHLSG